jgi:hypothetical protein
MVLMITAIPAREQCADAIRELTGDEVRTATDLSQAFAILRTTEFSVVVVDQLLMWEAGGNLADQVAVSCGTAALMVTNFAICGVERVAREARAALRRRHHAWDRARKAAASQLRAELNEAVTGILLSSELALRSPGLPTSAASKIQAVYELATSIRERLEAA